MMKIPFELGFCISQFSVNITKYLRLGILIHSSKCSRAWHWYQLGSGECHYSDGSACEWERSYGKAGRQSKGTGISLALL